MTLEDAVRPARRVLGSTHPTVVQMETSLRLARAALRARETPSVMSNDTDAPPLALSNEAAQPVRDPQPESSVDAALGLAFTSKGKINVGRGDA